ncbi:prolyl oligopeptidase family serine peptidase [Flavobacteriaceae bacterium 3-367]
MESSKSTYHGVVLEDHYSWLDSVSSDSVKQWAKLQDSTTMAYVGSFPKYEALKTKVENLTKVSGRMEVPFTAADSYFYLQQEGEGRNWGLYTTRSTPGNGKKLELPFNPRTALFTLPSPDAKYLALGVSQGGGIFDWKVYDVEKQQILDATMTGSDMGRTRLGWTNDSKGFYYVSSNKVGEDGTRSELRIKYHTIHTAYEKDKEVFTPSNDGVKLEFKVSTDDKYLVIEEREGASIASKVFAVARDNFSMSTQNVVVDNNASYVFLGNKGPLFYFETDDGAPNGKIMALDIGNRGEGLKEVVAETDESIMGYQSAGGTMLPLIAKGRLVVPYQKDLKLVLRTFDLEGKPGKTIELPSGGLYFNTNGLNALTGNQNSKKVLTRFMGITEPNTVFEIDVESGEIMVFQRANVSFNVDGFFSEIVFCESKDGTRIPISLTYKKDTKLDGSNPLMMQVYGAIAFTNYPYFQGDYISWLDMGGIHAVAHIRGGGAYGAKWHQDGIRRNKQNGVDDYIAAIEWVIENKYTSPEKVVVNGVSAGTIPVGAVLVQRPELIGAVVSHYGMMDMIGYEGKFAEDASHGYMLPEIGKASVKEDFEVIRKYSPYQNINTGKKYPAVLAMTSDADAPLNADSYKLIAKLQANNDSKCPMLLQMAWGSWHSTFGSQEHPPSKTFTDEMSFLIKALDLDVTTWLGTR